MRKKIFLYYVVLIVIAVSVTGFFTSQIAQKFYKYEVEEKLKTASTMIEYYIGEKLNQNRKIDYNETAHILSTVLSKAPLSNTTHENTYRITFIDFKGNVLGESDTNYHKMPNHSDRKEIQEAIKGKVGKDIRFSQTMGYDHLYVATPFQKAGIIVRISVPLVQLKNIDRIIFYYTIISILAGLFITTLLALRFSSSITKPINEFILMAKEISNGNYSKRVDIKSNYELGQLAESFNGMASELEKSIESMRDKNIKVDSIINSMTSGIVAVDSKFKIILINSKACEMFNISNGPGAIDINIIELIRNNRINLFLKETMDQNIPDVNEIIIGPPEDKVLRILTSPIKSPDLSNKNAGAIATIQDITNIKKLEQIRTEFVSNVTHELKTPLTSIRGFIETLKNGAINDKNVADKFMEIIDIEAERLSMLINDILQLSEIESKQKDIHIGTYNLKPIIQETIEILQGLAKKKDISLTHDLDDEVKIIANKDRIKQMMINLIDNAIKYNVEGGSVHVKTFKSEGSLSIIVKDTGIGIEEEHLIRIFERFYRVDKGRSRNLGGTGLGLSIVKHIVNLYNGDIKVNSTLGKGSEFIIRFPVN
ncbi:MAG: cell wall metabolism sensor histidine kinase WalK [Clostridia bacterium]|nr:cell wall metabolism sensor histidine kinase WalK [Clostridia bacterium]